MKSSTYVDQLFIEYNQSIKNKKTYGFKEWLEMKKKSLKYYYTVLERLGYDYNKSLIELNKGNLDSIGLVMRKPQNLIQITSNNSLIEKSHIHKINGKLIIDQGLLKVNYGKEKRSFNLRNQQYSIQLPIDDDTIELAQYLMVINEKVYFGAYGNMDESDFDNKNNIIYNIMDKMKLCGLDMDINMIDKNNLYAIAIANKVKVKK